MTTDAEIACPDPHCGARFRITRLGRRTFSHAEHHRRAAAPLMAPPVPRVALAPGYTIPRLIKGGWQLAGGHGAVDRAAALDDMSAFVAAGMTTFDCADIYTGVEALIGDFVRRARRRLTASRSTRSTCRIWQRSAR